MRKRPTQTHESFIDEAVAAKADTDSLKEDLHKYVRKSKWPVTDEEISPSLAEGGQLRRPINLPLKEYEWNSIDRHTKTLGVNKTEWIRHAILKQLQEEQIYFLKHKKEV